MILKQRGQKLLHILIITFIIIGMVGIVIPKSILAANNSISKGSLSKGSILLPDDEVTEMTDGSERYILYAVGSGKFNDLPLEDKNYSYGYSYGFYCDGNRFQYSKPRKSEYLIMSYEDVISKSIDGFPADPLPDSSVFVGWIVVGVRSNEVQLMPIIVNYADGLKPKVQYNQLENVFEVAPENLSDDSILHGTTVPKITEDMIASTNYSLTFNPVDRAQITPCNVTVPSSHYVLNDLNAAKIAAKTKAVINSIEDVELGEKISLSIESIQLTDYLSDLRYVPDTWSVSKLGLSGTFHIKEGNAKSVVDTYTSEIPTDKAGDYTVDVSWKGQVLQDGTWIDLNSSKDYAKVSSSANYTVIESSVPDTKPEKPIQPEQPTTPVKPEDNAQGNENVDVMTPVQLPNKDTDNQTDVKETTDQTPKTEDSISILTLSLLCVGSGLAIVIYMRKKRSS